MNDSDKSNGIVTRTDYQFTFDFIISKVKNSDGKLDIIGKTLFGALISLGLLFLFVLGYLFMYGVYLGNGRSGISILEIGLDIVPIDNKFSICIGILILILTTIFIIPIKNFIFKEGKDIKIFNLLCILVFGFISIYVFKCLLIGDVIFEWRDRILIIIPLVLPLIIFSWMYIIKFFNCKKDVAICLISIIITLVFCTKLVQHYNNENPDISNWLVVFLIPMIAVVFVTLRWAIYKIFKFVPVKKQKYYDVYSKEEKSKILILISPIVLVSMVNFYVGLGSFYGTYYVKNNSQVISYMQNSKIEKKIGIVIGCKDNNYYISEYPNRNLFIIKSSEVSVESHVLGWQNVEDKWYYFNSDGEMLVKTKTPDGYNVDETGAWVK